MIPPREREVGDLATVMRWLSPHRRTQLAAVAALSVLGGAAELASIGAVLPFISLLAEPDAARAYPGIGPALSAIASGTDVSLRTAVTCLFMMVVLVSAALRVALTRAMTAFAHGVGHDVSVRIHDRLLRQEYRFHLSHNSSDLLAGVTKVSTVVSGVLMPALDSFVAALLAVTILAGLLLVDWGIAISAALLFSVTYVAISVASRQRIRRNAVSLSAQTNERIKALQESFGGIRDLLLDGSQSFHVARFARSDDAVRRAMVENAIWAQVPRWGVEAFGVTIIAAMAVVASDRQGGVSAALPSLAALALGAQKLLPLFQRLYLGWNAIASNRAMLQDVARLAALPLPDARESGDPRCLPFRTALELRGAGLRYAPSTPWILRDVHLRIQRGARVGFTGPTGCGKSTLLDLIMGLISPDEGSVLVDGVPLQESNRAHWTARVAHVPQSIYLADVSIAENIALGEDLGAIDHVRVEEAARRARVHDVITRLPHGYETPVGERGVRLSGGQRQRIGIARALYRQADVLVLDEATSALDIATEAAVMEGIGSIGADVTVLIVAHRESALDVCDTIVTFTSAGSMTVLRRGCAADHAPPQAVSVATQQA